MHCVPPEVIVIPVVAPKFAVFVPVAKPDPSMTSVSPFWTMSGPIAETVGAPASPASGGGAESAASAASLPESEASVPLSVVPLSVVPLSVVEKGFIACPEIAPAAMHPAGQ